MFKVISTILVFSLTSTLFGKPEDICNQRHKYFSQPKQDIAQSFYVSSMVPKDIFLIAVEHFSYEDKTYPLILNALILSGNSPDCFFLEAAISDDEEKQINSMNRGEPIDWDVLSDTLGFSIVESFKYFQQMKVKVYAVDSDVEDDDDISWLNKRDKLMALKIKKIMDSKTCKRPFFPVGAMHVISGYKGRFNLVENLSQLRFSTLKTGLAIAGIRDADHKSEHRIGSIWAFTQKDIKIEEIDSLTKDSFICRDIPSIHKTPYSLPTKEYYFPVLNDEKAGLTGMINDVDFWIYYTCLNKSCTDRNQLLIQTLKNIGLNFF